MKIFISLKQKLLFGGFLVFFSNIVYFSSRSKVDKNQLSSITTVKDKGYDLSNKLTNLEKISINIPKLKFSIRILIKVLEELENEEEGALIQFKEYIGSKINFATFRSDIKKIKEWWLSPEYSLVYENTNNAAHASYTTHTISLGQTLMRLPVMHNIKAEKSIVSTLLHESTHAVLGFKDYSVREGDEININDIYHDSKHGHYLYPRQCMQFSVLNQRETLKNPQCWEHALITNYAYSKLCTVVSDKKYNKSVCKYSDHTNTDLAKNWLAKIIKSVSIIKNNNNNNERPKLKEVADIILKKDFSLLITSHEDECKKDEKFHGNKKNIVICQLFMKKFIDSELTKFFFQKLADSDNQMPTNILDDLIGILEYNAEII